MNIFDKQARSRAKLAQAVAEYVNLRAGDGGYDTVVPATDRLGRKVSVFVNLNIVSAEVAFPHLVG